jgi:hypothetical protein
MRAIVYPLIYSEKGESIGSNVKSRVNDNDIYDDYGIAMFYNIHINRQYTLNGQLS